MKTMITDPNQIIRILIHTKREIGPLITSGEINPGIWYNLDIQVVHRETMK